MLIDNLSLVALGTESPLFSWNVQSDRFEWRPLGDEKGKGRERHGRIWGMTSESSGVCALITHRARRFPLILITLVSSHLFSPLELLSFDLNQLFGLYREQLRKLRPHLMPWHHPYQPSSLGFDKKLPRFNLLLPPYRWNHRL
jgi:hypothetical protein